VLTRAHAERAVNRFGSVLADIGDIMESDLGMVTLNTPLAAAAQRMIEDQTDVIFVTDSEGRRMGILSSSDLHRALVEVLVEDKGVSHHAA
jgi:CBS domain-containing protein